MRTRIIALNSTPSSLDGSVVPTSSSSLQDSFNTDPVKTAIPDSSATTTFFQTSSQESSPPCPALTIFMIPNWSEAKSELIQSLGGHCIEKSDTEGYAKIEIASNALLKTSRDQLEITRFRITLDTDVEEKCDYLTTHCHATIEPETSNKYLTTYPSQFHETVKQVTYHWDEIIVERDRQRLMELQ